MLLTPSLPLPSVRLGATLVLHHDLAVKGLSMSCDVLFDTVRIVSCDVLFVVM